MDSSEEASDSYLCDVGITDGDNVSSKCECAATPPNTSQSVSHLQSMLSRAAFFGSLSKALVEQVHEAVGRDL